MNNYPIGVFDSGLGGLTVVKEIKKVLPNEDIVYLGDTARVPYGTRSKETVTKFSFEDAAFLLKQKVKCIVIACNTASALAGDELIKKLNIPVFEVITPTSKVAVRSSKNRSIGVIGTRATISSNAYQQKIKQIQSKISLSQASCPLYVSFVEEGEVNGKLIEALTQKYLADMKKKKVDTLILGCTHYPVIEKVIQKEMGKNVKLINPGKALAKYLKESLTENNLLNETNKLGRSKYFVTDLTDRFISVAEMFLGEKIQDSIEKVNLE